MTGRELLPSVGLLLIVAMFVGCSRSTSDEPRPETTVVETVRTSLSGGSVESEDADEIEIEASGYGTLSGTFRFNGDAPIAPPINVTKDQAVCGQHDLVDEKLKVDPNTKGVADVVLFLTVDRGQKLPTPHPSYDDMAEAEVRLDNLNCRYEPHVVALRTGQTLLVGNKDSVGHNTKVDTVKNVPINPIIPAGGQISQAFPQEERLPVKVSCSIHPWMSGYVVIKETPYIAVTTATGEFKIENVPAGDWEFQVWQEKAGPVAQAIVNGQPVTWPKGKMKVSINADSVTQLDVLLDNASFGN